MKSTLLILLFLSTILSYSQPPIPTPDESIAICDSIISLEKKKTKKEKRFKITIPVVVHIIYRTDLQNISMEQIESQIRVLNEDFNRENSDTNLIPEPFKKLAANCNIHFVLANRDPNGNKTNGVLRVKTDTTNLVTTFNGKAYKISEMWDNKYYLNIWVCEIVDRHGMGSFPGGDPNEDGIIVHFNSFGTMGTAEEPRHLGRTATHEVGHWLGLSHLWGNDGLFLDDFIFDTPKQTKPNYYCPQYPHSRSKERPHGEMFMNFMDYCDDNCALMFTWGQREKMIMSINYYRSLLHKSKGYKKDWKIINFWKI